MPSLLALGLIMDSKALLFTCQMFPGSGILAEY